jgi:hypothetical protein
MFLVTRCPVPNAAAGVRTWTGEAFTGPVPHLYFICILISHQYINWVPSFQERACNRWVPYGVMEILIITQHINPDELGFINSEQPKNWRHGHLLLSKRHCDGTWIEPRQKPPCWANRTSREGSQTLSTRQPQGQVQCDAWTFISGAVISHPSISPPLPFTVIL